MVRCERMQGDSYLEDKENLESFSPIKTDELSMYEANTLTTEFVENSPSHCSLVNNRLLLVEEHDSNSQDSGYGTSCGRENGKFLSYMSRTTTTSFDSISMSMEDECIDFSDVEPLEKNSKLPEDFNKLITDPLAHTRERTSPKDTIIRPLFRRALSLQCTNTRVTPNSSRVRTNLFNSVECGIRSIKRTDPPTPEPGTSAIIKRSKMFDDEDEEEASVPEARHHLHRTISATEESIMCAVQRSSTQPDLIGDFTKSFSLPLTASRHQDLKAISAATLAQLMKGCYRDVVASFKVIDCRYPYEFDGGHIHGAINIYTKEQCMELLDVKNIPGKSTSPKRHVLIFHCEFSSERGPNLYRYLRKEDRQRNEDAYPNLFYPEIYLLEGGYKNFFEQYSEMCDPIAYKEMLHPDHEHDLRHFRQKSRTWNCDSRHRSHGGKNWRKLALH
ncbi:hypothetical protein NQ315_010273 [Exocentrus adspersus]|uniref:protein-tyrosine-phosphatase n=1 Tax=Exocentrus adspersus TaxID=1586481 RepID=A0AAV8WBY1_9CUCU|nr:hypothetical protein NQ315_010273 [Exocentrus adspersus]